LRVAVMASGRGSNFDALLDSTRDASSPAEIVVVVSDRPDAAVLAKARDAQVPAESVAPGTRRGDWAPEGVDGLLAVLRRHRTDAVCLAGFMRIVPPEAVREFPERMLNIHPSLLPAFPGLRPHRQALRAGVRFSGCTVHFVDDGVDTGPIVLQAVVPVAPDDTEETLAARVLREEHRIYPEALRCLAEGRIRVEGRVTRIIAPSPQR